jgi:hypothetical protein
MRIGAILRGDALTDEDVMEDAIRIGVIDVPSAPPANPEAEANAFRGALARSKRDKDRVASRTPVRS